MTVSDSMFDGDLARQLGDLERRIAELQAGRRLEDSAIGARGITVADGGNVRVDGGTLTLVNPGGVELAYFGPITGGQAESRGWKLKYDTGRDAFALDGVPGAQAWTLRDRAGNHLVRSDRTVPGVGLSEPHTSLRMVPAAAAEQDGTSMWPSTTSVTAVPLLTGVNPLWHSGVSIGVAMTGAGHWRLDINGDTTIFDETASGTRTAFVPDWGAGVNPGDPVRLDLYAWADTGRVSVQVDRLYGRPHE